ncbi:MULTISPECIES: nuclear transport factor 2 family protein [unclassified Nocardia]|uniref:nuclear transport factor 2 family protein n=1 Tax=unclassified Nocardia TaxID=2637762 RepID=UPI001CE46562|nr:MULTISPECIES: nuclear transport factor 2 family protein [unclassified Nocardia]
MTTTQILGAEQVVRRYFDALKAGENDIVRDSFADEATFWYPGDLPISGTWTGRDQIVDGFLGTAFALLDPDKEVRIEVTNFFAADDQVTVEWSSWGTVRNGNPYHNKNIAVFRVADGKIVTVREYANAQNWERALRDPQA